MVGRTARRDSFVRRDRPPLRAALRRSEPAPETACQRARERLLRALVGEVHREILRRQRTGGGGQGASRVDRPPGPRHGSWSGFANSGECLLWVKSRRDALELRCPPFLRKRKWIKAPRGSARGTVAAF